MTPSNSLIDADRRSKRDLSEMLCKFTFISVLYPLLQVAVYAVTGDITALTLAFVVFLLWLMIVLMFVFLCKNKHDQADDSEV